MRMPPPIHDPTMMTIMMITITMTMGTMTITMTTPVTAMPMWW
jgi:hypothetical protein